MWLRSRVPDDDVDLFRGPRSASPPVSPKSDVDVDDDGLTANLRELIGVLLTPKGVRMLKSAYRENMNFKVAKYDELLREAQQEVDHEAALLTNKTPDLKRASMVTGDDSNWQIFERIGQRYMDATDRVASFTAIKRQAVERLAGSMGVEDVRSNDAVYRLRDSLVTALRNLANFSSQPHIVATTVDIVGAYLKNPKLIQTKFLNFMMVGPAGTGKTTIAKAIATTFAAAGMFVGGKVTEAGRAEFVGEYEGQTVARTRNFLVSHLDRGVVFVDEAYALTQWDKGKPEGYGSEAVTAMVEFTTKYKGLYCLITAGYEKEMTRYFLPTNPGLTRRFPYRFVLRDLGPDDLMHVFMRTLLTEQGKEVPAGRAVPLESERYFTEEAWDYLRSLLAACTEGTMYFDAEEYDASTNKTYQNVARFVPRYPLMYALFENQAGSMTNLAEEAITVLMRTVTYEEAITVQQRTRGIARASIRTQDGVVMRDIIVQRISNSALSQADQVLHELGVVEDTLLRQY